MAAESGTEDRRFPVVASGGARGLVPSGSGIWSCRLGIAPMGPAPAGTQTRPMNRTGTSQLFTEEMPVAAEAAVLFAAGRAQDAMDLLRMQLGRGDDNPKPWLVLLDIYRIEGKRAAFETLTERYRRTFDRDAPCLPQSSSADPAVPGMVRVEGTLRSTADLAPVILHARNRMMVGVDMGGVERIDFRFAPEMCALLRGYGQQGKRIILANISDLHAELLETIGGGGKLVLLRRRAASHERWPMLQAA